MNTINPNLPPIVPTTVFKASTEDTVKSASGTGETQFETSTEMPPVTSSKPKLGSESSTQGVREPNEIPTTEDIQNAYDAINWEEPKLVDVFNLMVLIFKFASKLKAADNAAKWGETNLQVKSFMNEADNMSTAAKNAMWVKIGSACATVLTSSFSLVSSAVQLKQIGGLTGGKKLTDTDAAGNFEVTEDLFKRINADIGNIQLKGQIRSAINDIIKGVAQGGEAIAQNLASDQYNVAAKRDAAEATLRGANKDSVDQGEQAANELIRKAMENMQSLLQLNADTTRSIIQKI